MSAVADGGVPLSKLRYLWQWALLLCCVLPLLLIVVIMSTPVALLMWATGTDVIGRKMAAQRDAVLARAMQVEAKEHQSPLMFRLAALRLVYTTFVVFGLHKVLRLFVLLGRPKVVFGIYLANYHQKRKYFCVGTSELICRAGLVKGYMLPETPWSFMLGVIHVDASVGFGVWCGVSPCMSHVTTSHLQQLPAAMAEDFPHAQAIALAGRLPGLMKAAGVPIEAPLVDGLAGTLYAMEASVRALAQQLPPERKAHPTVAILGGGGYIGARLVAVLAPEQAAASKAKLCDDTLQHEKDHQERDQDCVDSTVSFMTTLKSTYRQIIALDTRFAGNRRSEGAVLYTAEPADLQAADVVLVITRNGDDVAEYIQHAVPGQVWGDDTHPEMSAAVLKQLHAQGVSVHKAMASRNPAPATVPPLDGWPAAAVPGCLLMALVSAATGKDWNGAAGSKLEFGKVPENDPYHKFAAVTKALGFNGLLGQHRRSRMDRDATKE